jgi:hypothetical protein
MIDQETTTRVTGTVADRSVAPEEVVEEKAETVGKGINGDDRDPCRIPHLLKFP